METEKKTQNGKTPVWLFAILGILAAVLVFLLVYLGSVKNNLKELQNHLLQLLEQILMMLQMLLILAWLIIVIGIICYQTHIHILIMLIKQGMHLKILSY